MMLIYHLNNAFVEKKKKNTDVTCLSILLSCNITAYVDFQAITCDCVYTACLFIFLLARRMYGILDSFLRTPQHIYLYR